MNFTRYTCTYESHEVCIDLRFDTSYLGNTNKVRYNFSSFLCCVCIQNFPCDPEANLNNNNNNDYNSFF